MKILKNLQSLVAPPPQSPLPPAVGGKVSRPLS